MRVLLALVLIVLTVGCDSAGDPETNSAVLFDDQGNALAGFDLVAEIPRPGDTSRGVVVYGARRPGATPRDEPLRVSRADDGQITFALADAMTTPRNELVGRLSTDGAQITGDVFYITDSETQDGGTFVADRQ